ncbi:MAG: 1-(5-phosphoribosyl)-5-((5-phosphoribosylamino)methylideneamino)imidazole-4-carboxamide isomerase, partial [Eggerthellaceae bacterium]|nr:1-(5-phosphoribosyl)-5-((5-phosphoribosylamino)methylideneamino)imidazole-4-carboxamide isomerase [Eggerthellaceae bacterium]
MYLLPAIDILGGRAVRLAKGDYNQVTVYNDDPVDQAKRFADAGAQWIHVVDLDGARSGVQENLAIVEAIAKCGLHIENGGGVRD